MKDFTYYEKQEYSLMQQYENIRKELPGFIRLFLHQLKGRPQTLRDRAYDYLSFLQYLQIANPLFHGINTVDISVDNFPIDFTKYYEKPSVLSDELIPICDAMNEYVKWSVTYDDGTVIHASTNAVKLNKKKEIVLNYDFLTEGLKKVSKSYNTVGKAVTFKNHSGKKIKVGNTKMSTWGNVVDTDKELSYLKSQFESKTSISDRKPEYLRKQGKIGNTYVEVSLSKQHVWVYVKGKLKMESDVVTGTKGKHDTPKGLYYMSECIPGKYLVGDGYKTWVNKWMRLTNQGVGLHDATWRSAFGGSIYTYSGSHGCINLPSSFADKLFKIAYTGMPVVIY